MSRRSQSGSDLILEMIWVTFTTIISILLFLIGVVVAIYRVPPKEKLLALQPPHLWGTLPDPLVCPQCSELNEFDAEICLSCGAYIFEPPKKENFLTTIKEIFFTTNSTRKTIKLVLGWSIFLLVAWLCLLVIVLNVLEEINRIL